jgi:hypothetical protein
MMNEKRIIQILISTLGLAIIVIHIAFPDLKIDGITVFLIAIVILPWLAPVFKSFELPGGLKVEYHDFEKATKKLKDSGLIQNTFDSSNLTSDDIQHSKYSFLNVVDIDSKLALSGLRMEIESRLKDLAVHNSISVDRIGINQIAKKLKENGILNKNETEAILEVLPILNSASHGNDVDKNTHKWAIQIGPQILDSLEARKGKQDLPDLIKAFKNRDGAQFIEIGHELSIHLIKSTKFFFEVMESETQVFSDWLDELETSTFTVFAAKDEIDEELEYAKHLKLKELMTEKVQDFIKNNERNKNAESVLARLKEIKIRSIW